MIDAPIHQTSSLSISNKEKKERKVYQFAIGVGAAADILFLLARKTKKNSIT